MQANRVHERTVVVLAATTLVVALAGVTSAAAASSGARPAASQGRVVFHCIAYMGLERRGPVQGQCTITGAITDRGRFVDDARQCKNPHVRTVNARKGTIRIEVYRGRGTWKILGGTEAYRGLRGHGWESSEIPCRSRGRPMFPNPRIRMVGAISP